MNLLNDIPFVIAAGLALVFLCLWGLCAGKKVELKNTIEGMETEFDTAKDECNLAQAAHLEAKTEIRDLWNTLEIERDAYQELKKETVAELLHLRKVAFILKKTRPALYNQERIDALYERLSNPKKIPHSITREAKEAAGTLAGIKKGGKG